MAWRFTTEAVSISGVFPGSCFLLLLAPSVKVMDLLNNINFRSPVLIMLNGTYPLFKGQVLLRFSPGEQLEEAPGKQNETAITAALSHPYFILIEALL